VVVQVSDGQGGVAQQAVQVRVADANDVPVLQVPEQVAVPQQPGNGLVVAQAQATDQDAGQVLTYSLADDAQGRFGIDAQTGQVYVADGHRVDYTQQAEYTVVVRVTDAQGASRLSSLRIAVVGLGNETVPQAGGSGAGGASAGPEAGGAANGSGLAVGAERNSLMAASLSAALARAGLASDETDAATALSRDPAALSPVRVTVESEGEGALARTNAGSRAGTRPLSDIELLVQRASTAVSFELTPVAALAQGADLVSDSFASLGELIGRAWGLSSRGNGVAGETDDVFGPRKPQRSDGEQLLIELTQPEKVASVSLTAGFVWWLTRGGGALATVLMGVPAWRHLDLLPVMARADEEGEVDDEEDEGLGGLFDRNTPPAADDRNEDLWAK
jgi:hypothetical protein